MPRKAMLSIDNKINVFVVTDGIAHKQEIRIGYQEGDYVEILSGLSGDEHVVITGHQNLKDQAPVEIVNPEALLLQAQSHEQAISNTPQQNEDNASLDANHTS